MSELSAPLGVSMSFVESILRSVARGATTADVCEEIVKKQTKGRECALIELYKDQLDELGRPYIAPASCFVSHAWKYDFNAPIDAMRQFEASHPNTYFWFDLFVNNQHHATSNDHSWWTTTFCSCIERIGNVLLVLFPWNDPVPLTRAWCLFEILCAILGKEKGVNLHVVLPESERAALQAGIAKNFNSIMEALVSIRAQNATAACKEDQEKIFSAIEQSCGFDRLNMEVKDSLRQWYIDTCTTIADSAIARPVEDMDADLALFFFQLASALKEFNNSTKSLAYFALAHEVFSRIHGAHHMSTVRALFGQAEVHHDLSNYHTSIKLARQVLNVGSQLAGWAPQIDLDDICGPESSANSIDDQAPSKLVEDTTKSQQPPMPENILSEHATLLSSACSLVGDNLNALGKHAAAEGLYLAALDMLLVRGCADVYIILYSIQYDLNAFI